MRFPGILFAVIFCLTGTTVKAQYRNNYEYGKEFMWGFNKNTAGGLIGGVIFRAARKKSDRMYESLGIELMNLKHSKERKRTSNNTGNYYIYGKLNYFYPIRLQYGRELIIFTKAEEQGVEIKANAAIGPSFGVLSPYYVEVNLDPSAGYHATTINVPYNSSIAPQQIYGTGRLFQGLDKAKVLPGANLKLSLSFELGTLKTHVTGFETGFLLDAYPGEVKIMTNTKNPSVIPTSFITLFYGTRK